MTFRFEKGTGKDYDLWTEGNAQLIDDLREIGAGNVPENELAVYIGANSLRIEERTQAEQKTGEKAFKRRGDCFYSSRIRSL